MKKALKISITIIVLLLLIFAGGIFYLNHGLEAGCNIEIDGLNMSNINDGVYDGKYQWGRWSNEVNVTVKDQKITDLEIVNDVTFVDPSVRDKLFIRVIEEQNTKVDVVSGSTVTSKAYLKSIENAFKNE